MQRTPEEETANAYSHLLASILALIITVALLLEYKASEAKLQFLLLGICSTWTFFSSFLYHSTSHQKGKTRNRVLDRAAIYVLIGGTGAAISLTHHDPKVGAACFVAIVMASSLLTIIYCMQKAENEVFSLVSYLLLGWMSLMPGTGALGESLISESSGLSWLIISICLYTAGILFYIQDSKKWYHTIWHIFVILGYSSGLLAHIIANNMV